MFSSLYEAVTNGWLEKILRSTVKGSRRREGEEQTIIEQWGAVVHKCGSFLSFTGQIYPLWRALCIYRSRLVVKQKIIIILQNFEWKTERQTGNRRIISWKIACFILPADSFRALRRNKKKWKQNYSSGGRKVNSMRANSWTKANNTAQGQKNYMSEVANWDEEGGDSGLDSVVKGRAAATSWPGEGDIWTRGEEGTRQKAADCWLPVNYTASGAWIAGGIKREEERIRNGTEPSHREIFMQRVRLKPELEK